jgi:hypothetical protein
MKTCAEFLEELKNHCAFQRDFQNSKGSMIKADAYEDINYKIEQFQAEQNQHKQESN